MLRLVLYRERVHPHDFAGLLLVACTLLLYSRMHTGGWKPCANRGPVCTLENFQWCGEFCFVGAAVLRGRCLSLIPRRGKHKSFRISVYFFFLLARHFQDLALHLYLIYLPVYPELCSYTEVCFSCLRCSIDWSVQVIPSRDLRNVMRPVHIFLFSLFPISHISLAINKLYMYEILLNLVKHIFSF
jgi:hypothetical protein